MYSAIFVNYRNFLITVTGICPKITGIYCSLINAIFDLTLLYKILEFLKKINKKFKRILKLFLQKWNVNLLKKPTSSILGVGILKLEKVRVVTDDPRIFSYVMFLLLHR